MKKIVNLDNAERVGKSYLIDYLVAEAGFKREDAEKAVNATLEAIVTALRSKTSVSLTNIGTLKPVTLAPRKRRNPHTGESYQGGELETVRWKLSPTLADVLNGRTVRDQLAVKAPKGTL